MSKNKLIEINVDILHETDAAFLVEDGNGTREWVPFSLVENNEDGTITLPEWLAQDKGFI